MFHRRFECTAWQAWRRDHFPADLREGAIVARNLGERFREQFAQGFFVDAVLLLKRPLSQPRRGRRQIGWGGHMAAPPGTLVLTGGPCLNGRFPALRSAGWAVIVMSQEGQVWAQAWGAAPPREMPAQSARAGEDYAAV
eukprot:9216521-Pyramimonas_sp.AAC.1